MSDSSPVGSVVTLRRYPVKSMVGEDLQSVEVAENGLVGDRAYALVDRSTGHVVSAKRPKRWPGILLFGASFTTPPTRDHPHPPVRITLPDGSGYVSTEAGTLEEAVSGALGNPVALRSVAPRGASFQYHWPDEEGLVWDDRTYRDEITEHGTHPGTFFDSAVIHLLTTSTVTRFGELLAGSDVPSGRFRPNLVIRPSDTEPGFVEDGWVGKTLRIGDQMRVRITRRCIRCVMVNLAGDGFEADSRVLKATFEHNEGHAGIKGDVLEPGIIRVGDPVRIE